MKRSYASSFGPLASGYKAFKKAKNVVLVAPRRNRAPRVKGGLRPTQEIKYVDVANAAYALDTTGSITLINGIAVGDDNTTRDGREVTIKSVQLKGWVSAETATQASSTKGRVMLIWDNATNGAAPTFAQVLNTQTENAFPNVDYEKRFTVLADVPIVIGPYNGAATVAVIDTAVKEIDCFRKINQITHFIGTGATSASIGNGGLYMLTFGNAAAGQVLTASLRVRYSDQ